MQQLPPIPEEPSPSPATPEPSRPGQPTHAPAEEPGGTPNIDVPSPPSPGTNPSPTPISPVG
jgi:hypothetical protein